MEVCPEPERIILQNSAAFGNDSLDIGQRGETQMIRHMRHGSPPRLMAPQPIRVPERRESHPTPSAGNRITHYMSDCRENEVAATCTQPDALRVARFDGIEAEITIL